ncbi:MAG: PH domain-containing protein [Acetobacteraceae bacterium]|nr:PH domain-containing protein [Acetobacteraceae bacterium]
MSAHAQIGLPRALPADEPILWQGKPSWTSLLVRLAHIRILAFYFIGIMLISSVTAVLAGVPRPVALDGVLRVFGTGVFVVLLAAIFAWLTHYTTLYTVTSRHLVMRFGIAIQATLILPLHAVEHMAIRPYDDGSGDVSLAVKPTGTRLTFLKLWPHLREWRVFRPQPMLRSVPNAEDVGALLRRQVEDVARRRAMLAAADAQNSPDTKAH